MRGERRVTKIRDEKSGVVVVVGLWEPRFQPNSMSAASSSVQQVHRLNLDPAGEQSTEKCISLECFCEVSDLTGVTGPLYQEL